MVDLLFFKKIYEHINLMIKKNHHWGNNILNFFFFFFEKEVIAY